MLQLHQKLTLHCLLLLSVAGLICIFSLASVKPTMADPSDVTISERLPVGLILLDDLMSGRSREGDLVHFEVIAPVYDNNNILLIPAGSFATGRVTRSKGSGMFGKRGELNFTCETINLPNGENVPLRGRKVDTAGANDTAVTAAVTVLVSPVGLLIKGGTVKVDRGTPIRMFLADGDVITPSNQKGALSADFTLKDKGAKDIFGTVTGFDGDNYFVWSDGQKQVVALDDISSITVGSPQPDNQ